MFGKSCIQSYKIRRKCPQNRGRLAFRGTGGLELDATDEGLEKEKGRWFIPPAEFASAPLASEAVSLLFNHPVQSIDYDGTRAVVAAGAKSSRAASLSLLLPLLLVTAGDGAVVTALTPNDSPCAFRCRRVIFTAPLGVLAVQRCCFLFRKTAGPVPSL